MKRTTRERVGASSSGLGYDEVDEDMKSTGGTVRLITIAFVDIKTKVMSQYIDWKPLSTCRSVPRPKHVLTDKIY